MITSILAIAGANATAEDKAPRQERKIDPKADRVLLGVVGELSGTQPVLR